MALNEKLIALSQVKDEIFHSLTDASRALDSFVESPSESTQIELCIEHLTQVQSTLQLVELKSGVFLVEEMNILANLLKDSDLEEDALAVQHEALMHAILQIPLYIDSLLKSQKDNPLALLATANTVRTARNAAALFSLPAPIVKNSTGESVIFQDILNGFTDKRFAHTIAKLRKGYQQSLISIARKQNVAFNLEKSYKVFSHLTILCNSAPTGTLWGLATAVIEASIRFSRPITDNHIKKLKYLDTELKRLILGGMDALRKPTPQVILDGFIEIIKSLSVKTLRIRSIKQYYNIETTDTSEEESSTQGPALEAIKIVCSTLVEQLKEVCNTIDLHVRSHEKDPDTLVDITPKLQTIANTLPMLSLHDLSTIVSSQISVLRALSQTPGSEETDKRLLDVSTDLLNVEANLNEMASGSTTAGSIDEQEANQQFVSAISIIIEEILKMLQAQCDTLNSTETLELAHIGEELFSLAGAARFIDAIDAYEVLQPCIEYINIIVNDEEQSISDENKQHISKIVTAVNLYFKGVESGNDINDIDALKSLSENVEALRDQYAHINITDEEEAASTSTEPVVEEIELQVPTLEPQNTQTGLENNIIDFPASAESTTNELEATADSETTSTIEKQQEVVAEQASHADDEPMGDEDEDEDEDGDAEAADEIDPEIIQFFVEEAQELLEAIDIHLPAWKTNHDDENSLIDLRRAYHTMKGSGRLVGAMAIGELAWCVEKNLNSIIDNSKGIQPEIFNLIEKSSELFPAMIENFSSQTASNDEEKYLIEYAERLFLGTLDSDDIGESLESAEAISNEAEAQQSDQQTTTVSDTESQDQSAPTDTTSSKQKTESSTDTLDHDTYTTLLSIFKKETENLLQIIDEFIKHNKDNNKVKVTEELQRVLHTLSGISRSVNFQLLCVLVQPVYRSISLHHERDFTASNQLPVLLKRLADFVKAGLEDLQNIETLTLNGTNEFLADANTYHQELVNALNAASIADNIPEPQAQEQAEIDNANATTDPSLGDEIDPEILDIFMSEADDLITALDENIYNWEQEQQERRYLDEMLRNLHTLKGSASLMGQYSVSSYVHDFESFMINFQAKNILPDEDFFHKVHIKQDHLINLIQALKEGKPMPEAPIESTQDIDRETVSEELNLDEMAVATDANDTDAETKKQTQKAVTAQAATETEGRKSDELLRVSSKLLHNIENLSGETTILKSRVEQQVNDFAFSLTEMETTISRLQDQLRRLETETNTQIMSRQEQFKSSHHEDFDPLEMDRYSELQQLSRSMLESASDLIDLNSTLNSKVEVAELLLTQQSRVNTALQEGVMRTRMVPFSNLLPRLRRLTRQVSHELNKPIDFRVENPDGEIDRILLESMTAPLEHMLRNALDHGIESQQDRKSNKKKLKGVIDLRLIREGNHIILELSDDGAGIDVKSVKKRAIKLGLMGEKSSLLDSEITQFILNAGFSTRDTISHISGRGVGMDVVYSEVKRLGGDIFIQSTPGEGTAFKVTLPFSMSLNRALITTSANETYAIPLNSIGGIIQVSTQQFIDIENQKEKILKYHNQDYTLLRLNHLLDNVSPDYDRINPSNQIPIILIEGVDRSYAIQVDHMIGSREIVVKSLGERFAELRGVSGATITGDGSVVIILDVIALAQAVRLREEKMDEQELEKAYRHKHSTTVLVVDDSVTVRKVTSRILEQNGMEVLLAKDGEDAMMQLQHHIPDLMLLDIEMPRMDGFEVATQVRHDKKLNKLPIIMITSRSGQKHKNRAKEIGVDRYMSKPFQEANLLNTIKEVLA